MQKLLFHIPPPLEGIPLALWFAPQKKGVFNEKFPSNFFENEIERVSAPAARAIVLPNNFLAVTAEAERYIKMHADEGERLGIPVFIFSLGDFTDHLRFDPRVNVFTFSAYKSRMAPNGIVMPTLTEDNGEGGIIFRLKGEKPLVSFCGMGGFPSPKKWLVYYLKVGTFLLLSMAVPLARAKIVGVYWRRAAMRACVRTSLVDTLFITRRTFSGSRKTIELDPETARREYLESIRDSDFVIAPKGDGNYSNRFLKALALGRFPILIDTDCVLPFENKIDYSKVIVRVPMNGVKNTPRYVRNFYDPLSPEEFAARQKLAREIFEKYLRQDSFFRAFFEAQPRQN